jgi:hypothetical protein
VIGSCAAVVLLLVMLVVVPIGLYKLQQRGPGVLIILGLAALLTLAAVWMLCRHLVKRAAKLLKRIESPELSPFLTSASAALAIVCC